MQGNTEQAVPSLLPGAPGLLAEAAAQLLGDGHSVRFKAVGHSMFPAIRDGEPITVAPVEIGTIRAGDIVLRRSGSKLVAHRVVRIGRASPSSPVFHLRGDASEEDDPPVDASQVIGRVIKVERAGRNLNPAGRLTFFLRRVRDLLRARAAGGKTTS